MFAKGARFPPEKTSIVPGPGFYKLPEESKLEPYKKGAFLEKTDRFRSKGYSDVPGPGAYNVGVRDSISRPGPSKPPKTDQGLSHLQQQIDTLKTQNAKMLKDHQQTVQKYRDKITHDESTIQSLVKDNVALQSQVSTEQALRAVLVKAETSTKGEAERASKLVGLQQKLQDLEKIHSNDKKRHQVEVAQLKCELDTSRKASSEQKELLAQLRRQQEASELQTKSLKKAIIADQGEIKELRMKVQNTAQAKIQLASRQDEVEHLKKSLQSLEIKHITEIQTQQAKLIHQEECLTSAGRRRKELEQLVDNLRSVRSEAEQEAQKAKDRIHSLQEELDVLTRSSKDALASAAEERQHLIDIQAILARVAEAYSHLAASSVSLNVYRESEEQCAALRLRNIRLERRLADRDALVEQLTDYCRQASDGQQFLARTLQELEIDQLIQLRRHHLDDTTYPVPEDISLIYSLLDGRRCLTQQQDSVVQADLHFAEVIGRFYEANFNDLLVSYAMAYRDNIDQGHVAERLVTQCIVLQTEADALRLNHGTAETKLSQKSVQIAEAVTREQVLNEQLKAHRSEIGKLEDTLEKERQTSERLARASYQSKKNEEWLRLEVDELVDNLADLTRYKEAHADLLAEVVALIERNELAEAEAERLGKFNAEILGHTNSNQKIFYIDRIRRELADTKHLLLQSTRDREDLAATNAALHHEVAAYKSIAVPLEQKLRGARIRIERPPLTIRNINELVPSIAFAVTPPLEDSVDDAPMTIDEIM